jgi:hypothetical protein
MLCSRRYPIASQIMLEVGKSSYVSVFKFPSKKIRMQEWMRILELENWRVRSLLLVPLGLKSILNYKPVLMVGSIHPSG